MGSKRVGHRGGCVTFAVPCRFGWGDAEPVSPWWEAVGTGMCCPMHHLYCGTLRRQVKPGKVQVNFWCARRRTLNTPSILMVKAGAPGPKYSHDGRRFSHGWL